jgi:hypothetical protein
MNYSVGNYENLSLFLSGLQHGPDRGLRGWVSRFCFCLACVRFLVCVFVCVCVRVCAVVHINHFSHWFI